MFDLSQICFMAGLETPKFLEVSNSDDRTFSPFQTIEHFLAFVCLTCK